MEETGFTSVRREGTTDETLTRFHNRRPVIAATALLGLTSLVSAPAAAAIPAQSISDTVAAQAVPQSVPFDEIVPGMTGTGLTVSRGRTPEPFIVTVLGVLPGAIGIGVDVFVFEAASPALDTAGGIWGGMSGSPGLRRAPTPPRANGMGD